MTIANEITKLNTNLTASYTACNNKGATMPANQNFDNLANCIGSIQTGSTPTLITKTITANGTYNASSDNADGYSSVTVNVSGGGGINLLTANYLSNDGTVSLSFDAGVGDYGVYVLADNEGRTFGQYNTILLGTTSDQIAILISFMRDLYNVKDQGLDNLFYTIFYDDYGGTFIPILLPSLNTIEVYDFYSGDLQWTLTLAN